MLWWSICLLISSQVKVIWNLQGSTRSKKDPWRAPHASHLELASGTQDWVNVRHCLRVNKVVWTQTSGFLWLTYLSLLSTSTPTPMRSFQVWIDLSLPLFHLQGPRIPFTRGIAWKPTWNVSSSTTSLMHSSQQSTHQPHLYPQSEANIRSCGPSPVSS